MCPAMCPGLRVTHVYPADLVLPKWQATLSAALALLAGLLALITVRSRPVGAGP
jgi:hypothetical protein